MAPIRWGSRKSIWRAIGQIRKPIYIHSSYSWRYFPVPRGALQAQDNINFPVDSPRVPLDSQGLFDHKGTVQAEEAEELHSSLHW